MFNMKEKLKENNNKKILWVCYKIIKNKIIIKLALRKVEKYWKFRRIKNFKFDQYY
jgi:hypothetical protein